MPRVRSLPAGSVESRGQQAIDFAAACGLVLDEWQQLVLRDALGRRKDGKWSAFEVCVLVPRQNGKGAILEALELAALFLWDEQLVLHSAHQFKTAREAFLRMSARIASVPDLSDLVLREWRSHGDEGFELKSGARLRYVARSGGSGRGFTADRVVLDEAYELDAAAMGALLPTLSTVPNPQIWYASSAPWSSSSQLHAVRRRGLAGDDPGLCFLEWSVDPDDYDEKSVDDWARANPALGIRIPVDFVAAEQQALLGEPGVFARERLGIPDPEPDQVGEPAVDVGVWHGLANPKSRIGTVSAFGVDVDPGRTRCAVSVSGVSTAGLVHVETVEARPMGAWLVPRILELQGQHGGVVVLEPGSAAASLIPDLQELGEKLVCISRRDVIAACGRFADLVAERKLVHIDQTDLNVSVANAARRRVGDAFIWDRRPGVTTDLTPLYSATLAAWPQQVEPARPVFF